MIRIFIGGYKFERDGGRLLDARTLFHYLYGPLQPFFDQTWRPDHIVKA